MSGSPDTGPYLAMAVLCEKVLDEKDGVLSVIRIIDRVTQTVVSPEAPDEMPPASIPLTCAITFRSGEARGRHSVKLRPEAPSGEQMSAFDQPIHLEGEERGANLVVSFTLQAEMEGLYWIDLLFDDKRMTRIPLRVVYQPQRIG